MLIDGQKYACDACVRGHRVSNCQHADRPLTHINKKGRPVSQCPHCRGLRKSHASHVKCMCGDKTHAKAEGAQAEKGDSKSGTGRYSPASDYGMDSQLCGCNQGARCTCALKKDHLDSVPEIDMLGHLRSNLSKDLRKPRLSTAQSDGSLTVFANGHHKPVHKFNHAAHESGLPYKIPRPHSIHGQSSTARKSSDSLPLVYSPTEDRAQLHDSIYSAQQGERLVRSEHGSPGMRPSFNELNGQLPHLDLLYLQQQQYPNVTSSPVADGFNEQAYQNFEPFVATPEEQSALSGVNMPPVDWSAFDLGLDNRAYTSAYSQPPSYASLEQGNFGQPGLTASSSGEMSEVEDPLSHGIPSPGVTDTYYSPAERVSADSYHSSNGSTYVGMPQTTMMNDSSLDQLRFDGYLQSTTASPNEFEDYNHAQIDPETFIRHGLTVQDAQKMAHPIAPVDQMRDLSIPAIRENPSNLWTGSYGRDDLPYDPASSIPGRVWRS